MLAFAKFTSTVALATLAFTKFTSTVPGRHGNPAFFHDGTGTAFATEAAFHEGTAAEAVATAALVHDDACTGDRRRGRPAGHYFDAGDASSGSGVEGTTAVCDEALEARRLSSSAFLIWGRCDRLFSTAIISWWVHKARDPDTSSSAYQLNALVGTSTR